MRYRQGQAGISRLAASIGVAAVIGGHLLVVPAAFAANTTVNATVCDQTLGTLHIASPATNAAVNKADTVISGQVSKLSQIRAYINGVFHTTVPLDTTSTTFSYTTNLSPGNNTVKLVGIDPCNVNGPVDEIKLVYNPALPVNPVTQVTQQTKSSATAAAEYFNGQVAEAAQTKPVTGLSGVVYNVMQALDIAPVAAPVKDVNEMARRFVGVTAGVVLMFAAQPIVAAYHFVRYQLMQWNIHALPMIVRKHAHFVLRLIGAGLLIGSFFI